VAEPGLTRRRFLGTLAGLGLAGSPAFAVPPSSRRGGGGQLRLLSTPTTLNPYMGQSNADEAGSRLFYEPLATFDEDGALVPVLADHVPTVENGEVAKDGTWVTWHLKRGVVWHDGRPFTADDVVFNWEYVAHPGMTTRYQAVERVERLHDHAVRVVFKEPTPFWPEIFCGARGLIPRHLHQAYRGDRARESPQHLRPVGTGPYRCLEFRPGDLIRAELNPHYHVPNRPHFDEVVVKGGGDAVSAARAVLQTGEYDFAFNVLVEDEILRRLEGQGRGRIATWGSVGIEHISLNRVDPWSEDEGPGVRPPHPLLGDPAVRAALSLLVDRGTIASQLYGRLGRVTTNFLNSPPAFVSPNTRWEFDVDKANRLLETAGWARGPDGVRVRDGRRLRLLFQTSSAPIRQKTQAVIKQACARAGIEVELKAVPGSVFGSADANRDSMMRFRADLQMYTVGGSSPDPGRLLERYTSWRIPTKANGWIGGNHSHWRNEEYDRLWRAARMELDPARRAAMFVRMNDLVFQDVAFIPILERLNAVAISHRLHVVPALWDTSLAYLAFWTSASRPGS
jgi:peptide/nickel transport system substrate-binding protein